MLPTRQGSIRLFRLGGIEVFVHWWWFLAAIYQITVRRDAYSSLLWNILEYLALFAIVLMHEFGHALACRQVGGKADQIILWLLGGVAYVSPPPRPGATLWAIAAGPLVNVVLMPLFTVAVLAAQHLGWEDSMPNAYHFVQSIWLINIVLLVFNILPIYPLDGGQIVRALLWFFIGKSRSLMVASIIGFVGVALAGAVAIVAKSPLFWVMAAFILFTCWRGLMQARVMAKLDKMPKRAGFACPSCKLPPIAAPIWICPKCRARFDMFENNAFCPNCGEHFRDITCLECGEARPLSEWQTAGFSPPPPPLPGRE